MAVTRALRQTARRADAKLEEALEAHRAKVKGEHRVRNAEGLVTMVDAFGFCFAFTLRTGDAPIPACFDHLSTTSEDRGGAGCGTGRTISPSRSDSITASCSSASPRSSR